jgi:transcriptional regulator with XRE-family HTH domain
VNDPGQVQRAFLPVSNSIAIGGTPLDTPSAYFCNLGKALFLLRDLRGKSQADVARRAGIGKSQLSKYENGKELPKLDSLERVLVALDIDYVEFFHTLALIDRRARTLGQGGGLEELLAPGTLGKPRDVEPPSMPGLSEGIAGGFEAVFVLLSRLQRQVWEEGIYPRGKKEAVREEPDAALP